MTTYTGDIKIVRIESGEYDIKFVNGQPDMTNGLETLSILAVFGEKWWGNELTQKQSEKMQSTFPDVIKRNVVTDKTKNDGTEAIKKALAFFVSEKIAKSVTVTGEIINAFQIDWLVEIESLTDKTIKYYINWAKGELTAQFLA